MFWRISRFSQDYRTLRFLVCVCRGSQLLRVAVKSKCNLKKGIFLVFKLWQSELVI